MRQHCVARACLVLLLAIAALGVACQNKPTQPSSTSGTSVPVSALVTIAESATVEQVKTGQTATNRNYPGQSATVPAGASYNNIRFNWDGAIVTDFSAQVPRGAVAAGTLVVLTQEYLGLPESLGSATPGFLAQSQRIEQGQYVFAPSVTLKAGTKYWFYAYWPPGSAGLVNWVGGFSEDTYSGGDGYVAAELGGGIASQPFRKLGASWRVISLGPPIEYYKPPAGTYIDVNFKLMGAPGQ